MVPTQYSQNLVASYVGRRAPSRSVAAGLAVGVSGTLLVAVPAMNEGHSGAIGVAMILAALVSYGFAPSIARSPSAAIWRTSGDLARSGSGVGPDGQTGAPDLMAAHWSILSLLSLLALGAFGTANANVLMASAAGHFGAARGSGTTFLIPVVALVLGVVLLHEQVDLL